MRGEGPALKSGFEHFPLAFPAPDHHVSQGTTLVLTTKALKYWGEWGSAETYSFCYLLPLLVWLKCNSDVTSQLFTGCRAGAAIFLWWQKRSWPTQCNGEKKRNGTTKHFPCLIPKHIAHFCSGPPLFSYKGVQSFSLSRHSSQCLGSSLRFSNAVHTRSLPPWKVQERESQLMLPHHYFFLIMKYNHLWGEKEGRGHL